MVRGIGNIHRFLLGCDGLLPISPRPAYDLSDGGDFLGIHVWPAEDLVYTGAQRVRYAQQAGGGGVLVPVLPSADRRDMHAGQLGELLLT